MDTLIEIRKINKNVPVVILTGQGDDRIAFRIYGEWGQPLSHKG